MNKVILLGRVVRDPETKYTEKVDSYGQTQQIPITRFSIAVDRRFKTEGGASADFPSCVAFGKTAEFISKYFKQGMKIALEGRIQTGSYEKDGVKHYTTDVIAEAVEFAESKKAEGTPPREESNEWLNVPEGIENDLPFK